MTTDALILIDPQVDTVNMRIAHLAEPVTRFLREWVETGRPTIITRFVNPPGSSWERFHGWPGMRHAPETDLIPAAAAIVAEGHPNVLVTERAAFTALTDEAQAFLVEHGVDRALITGFDTDSGVLKTALDLFEQGRIEPVVLSDLVGSHTGDDYHRMGLAIIARQTSPGQVRTSAGVEIGAATT